MNSEHEPAHDPANDSVNWHEIRQLLTTLNQTDIGELILEAHNFRLVARKLGAIPGLSGGSRMTSIEAEVLPAGSSTSTEALTPAPPVVAAQPEQASTPPPKAKPSVIPAHWVAITAPMVGTFYSAPAPGEADFVKLGERIQKGQTVCIVEAMKLMNEVEAEASGRVVEVLVQNSQPVEYGQVLMRIDPNG